MNYEVSVRYLKDATSEQVKEIFQRINKTEYALNKIERLNAQWGDSEFICFAKQMIEPDFDLSITNDPFPLQERNIFLSFFQGVTLSEDGVKVSDGSKEKVFSESDMDRMLALQYMMTLVATVESEEYFARNDKSKNYIELYNDDFSPGLQVREKLLGAVMLIESLNLDRKSMWFNRANLFSLLAELSKNTSELDLENLKNKLMDFDEKTKIYAAKKSESGSSLSNEEIQYINYAREGVNEKPAREFRGKFIRNIINTSIQNVSNLSTP